MKRHPAVLLLALVVAACGSGVGGGGGEPDARIEFKEPLVVGPVRWKVVVTNDTTRAVDLTFPTGQRAEVTLSQNGHTIYQWSHGQMFTQVVGHVRIAAGKKTIFSLDEPGVDVDPGTYTLTAWVTCSNRHDLRDQREVTIKKM